MAYGARLESAFTLAAQLHRSQRRKGGPVPYIAHLMAVAALVAEAGGSEDEVIAALLHDAVEDQGGARTLAKIEELFGEQVAGIVESCSDSVADTTEQKVPQKAPWRQRKEKYLAHLAEASDSARLVSCADKLHNARSILADFRSHGDAVWEKFKGGHDTLWYYREVVRAFETYGAPPRLLDELARTVKTIHELAGAPYQT